MKFPAIGEVFFFFSQKVPHWFPSVVFFFSSRGLTQALRTKSSDTNCCVLGIGGDMYEEKILLLKTYLETETNQCVVSKSNSQQKIYLCGY